MKKTKPVQERRKNVRLRIYSLVKYAIEPDATTFPATNIRNVSRDGLAFFTEHEIKEGAVLRLYFLPPNREKPVEVRGKVVGCPKAIKKEKTFEIRVHFLDVSEDAKLAIRELEAFFLEKQKKIRP